MVKKIISLLMISAMLVTLGCESKPVEDSGNEEEIGNEEVEDSGNEEVEGVKKFLDREYALKHIDLTYGGIEPYIVAYDYVKTGDWLLGAGESNFKVYIDAPNGTKYKNGDTVRVVVDLDTVALEESGYVVENSEWVKEITIEGIDRYVTEANHLNAEGWKSIKNLYRNECEHILSEGFLFQNKGVYYGSIYNGDTVTPPRIVGAYLMKDKDIANNPEIKNMLAIVYQSAFSATDGNGDKIEGTGFMIMSGDTLIANSEGEILAEVENLDISAGDIDRDYLEKSFFDTLKYKYDIEEISLNYIGL